MREPSQITQPDSSIPKAVEPAESPTKKRIMRVKPGRKISNIPRSPPPKERIHETLESAEEKKIEFTDRFKKWQEERNKTWHVKKTQTQRFARTSGRSQNLGSLRTSQVLSSNNESNAAEEVIKKPSTKVVKRKTEQLQKEPA